MRKQRSAVWVCLVASVVVLPAAVTRAYDPLVAVNDLEAVERLSLHDLARDREMPLLVALPAIAEPAPVVLFSHGLGGSREACRYLREHWASRGYVAVFLQHPGSDSSVWQGVPLRERRAAMQAAASPGRSRDRIGDVGFVLDALAEWNADASHPFAGRFDLEHVGMSGHSFGAHTTQAVSGQSGWPARNGPDPRIDAAVIFSPGSPAGMRTPKDAFGEVAIPWLLMTGTEDVAPVGNQSVETRLAVFPALPPGSKYELVFEGGTHAAFTDGGEQARRRNPNHHRAIQAITTAFWDAFLRGDKDAAVWLDGDGPRSMLEAKDRWQTK